MEIDLNAVKSYCRVDGDEDNQLLEELIAAAKDYLDGAGVPEPASDDPLYLWAVKAMTLHFYDHRGMVASGESYIPGMQNTVTQLKLRAEAARAAGVDR